MTQDQRPSLTPQGQADAEERRRRQAEALRANLARRKAQARARDEVGSGAKTDPNSEEPPSCP